MWRFALLILIICVLFFGMTVFSQEARPIPSNLQEGSTSVENSNLAGTEGVLPRIWYESAWKLAIGVLVFATLLISANFYVMVRSARYWTDRSFKAFSLTLIICAGLFLIVIGFSDKQLAPMMGLLGTLAGYIFLGLR